jgi:hypothetical protein
MTVLSGPLTEQVYTDDGLVGYSYGLPCEGQCAHPWCPVTREMAAEICVKCGEPHGFLKPLVSCDLDLVHLACVPGWRPYK